MVKLLIKLC